MYGTDIPIEIVGGLVSDMAATQLPAGVSPDCKDIAFSESGARTRPGLGVPIGGTPLTGNVVNYLKTFITSNGTLRALAMTDLANLYKETAPGAFGLITQLNDVTIAAPYADSTTIFNREYLALSDGKFGVGMPRQFDDVNLDRVSQVGPGAAPAAADQTTSYTITASPNGLKRVGIFDGMAISTITQVGVLATLTATGSWFTYFQANDTIKIAGAGVAGYNGTYTVVAVLSLNSLTFIASSPSFGASAGGTVEWGYVTVFPTATTAIFSVGAKAGIAGAGVGGYNGNAVIRAMASPAVSLVLSSPAYIGLANSGNGTLTLVGNISAGTREVSVIFVTRQQYLTAPAPFTTWTAAGGNAAIISGIPIGPPNIIQRILCFTGAGGANFFYVTGANATLPGSDMVIADNSSTQVTVDFTDAILLAGTNVDALYNQVELGECAGVIDYKLRNFWWGERAKIGNFNNLTFDGGFTNPGGTPNFPLGWTQDAVFASGGASALAQIQPTIWGDAYAILGNGATATRGLITQSAAKDFRGVPILQAGTAYSARFRARWAVTSGGAPTAGNLQVQLFSASAGSLGLFTVAFGTLTSTYAEYIGPILATQTTIPADLQLRVYANGTPDNRTIFLIDNIELYVTSQPNNVSLVRASRVENPESFDGVTGLLQVAENNGQAMRAAFKVRERLYFVKEHSLHVTSDDASNEPSGWSVDEVSKTVGTPSVRGVGVGEDWVVVADRAGLYIFAGGEPQKISQEIGHSDKKLTLAWDQINWQYGHTLWVTVDTLEKRILVGAPFNGATSPNAILQLDYREIDPQAGVDGASNIAANGPIRIRFTGVMAVMAKSRKWSPWTPSINSCALIERADGSSHLWMGAGTGVPNADKGAIFDLQRTNLTDFSTQQQIPSYYTTSFTPQREQNQTAQTHEHRKLAIYLTMFVEGSGFVNLTAIPNQFGTFLNQRLPSLVLLNPAYGDMEAPIDVEGERIAFKISQSGNASWFRLQKFCVSMISSPTAPVRGSN